MLLQFFRKQLHLHHQFGREGMASVLNFKSQLFDALAVSFFQVVSCRRLLFVNRNQFLTEDIASQRLFDVVNARARQVRFLRSGRPHHHMHVRILFFVVIRSNPTHVARLDIHFLCDVVPTGAKKVHPFFRRVISKPFGILTLERNNKSPHVTGMSVYLTADGREIYFHAFVGEQTV